MLKGNVSSSVFLWNEMEQKNVSRTRQIKIDILFNYFCIYRIKKLYL